MDLIMVVGHAALPNGAALKSVYDNLALVAEISPKYGVITRCGINLASSVAEDFVVGLLVGHSLFDDVDEGVEEIRSRYTGTLTNALIAAYKDLKRNFMALGLQKGQKP